MTRTFPRQAAPGAMLRQPRARGSAVPPAHCALLHRHPADTISNPECFIDRERFCSMARSGSEGVAGLRGAFATKPEGKSVREIEAFRF